MLRPIAREHNISFGHFRRKYLATSTPVIIGGWSHKAITREEVMVVCGHRPLADVCDPTSSPVKYHVPGSQDWGSLADVPRNDRLLATFRQLLNAQTNASFATAVGAAGRPQRRLSGAELYLHDAPLERHCPALLERLHAPRYFPVDFLGQMGPVLEAPCDGRPAHPSLFVGQGRSQSGLHRDSLGTRFWMSVHEGTKAFRLTSPSATLLLKARRPGLCDERLGDALAALKHAIPPRALSELCGGYRFDLFAEGHEASALRAALATGEAAAQEGEGPPAGVVWDGEVGAGELIFIPELWGHQVRNLEASVAVSYNFVDDYNLRTHAALLAEVHAALSRLDAGPHRRPDQLRNTETRLALLGFDSEQRGFPAHSLAHLPDDFSSQSWAAFWERNRQTEPEESYVAQLEAWESAGGMERAMRRFVAEG